MYVLTTGCPAPVDLIKAFFAKCFKDATDQQVVRVPEELNV